MFFLLFCWLSGLGRNLALEEANSFLQTLKDRVLFAGFELHPQILDLLLEAPCAHTYSLNAADIALHHLVDVDDLLELKLFEVFNQL